MPLNKAFSVISGQPLNCPLRSLNRSSGRGVRTSGFADVSDVLLPHNSRTAGAIGSFRAPVWKSVRNIGSSELRAVCAPVAATGALVRASGKRERKSLAPEVATAGIATPLIACTL